MVRRSSAAATYREVDSDEDEQSFSEEEPEYKRKSSKKGSAKKSGPRGKISPAKTPASKRSRYKADDSEDDYQQDEEDEEDWGHKKKKAVKSAVRSRGINRSRYAESDDDEEEEEEEDEEVPSEPESEDDYVVSKKKRKSSSPSKKKASSPKKGKRNSKSTPKSAKNRKRSRYTADTSEEEEEDDESEEEDYDEDDMIPVKKATKKIKLVKPKESFPPVSEMVKDSIIALNEKKGSTMGAIKETILLNWDIDMPKYVSKIQKYIRNAVAMGELIQKSGTGLRGRWWVAGQKLKKTKRRKKKKKIVSEDEEGEDEYQAKTTKRDEDRVKDRLELERKREERAVWMEKVAADKAARPKKAPKPKQEVWEVSKICGHKVVGGKDWFLVKYDGPWKPQWEPEENVEGCLELIEQFLDDKEKEKEEKERLVREAEENGVYEVSRILDVKFLKNKKKEFLIRWKGWGADGDTWEDEDNLDCEDLINAFMRKVEAAQNTSEKSLRVAPKKVERMRMPTKRQRGNVVNYTDME